MERSIGNGIQGPKDISDHAEIMEGVPGAKGTEGLSFEIGILRKKEKQNEHCMACFACDIFNLGSLYVMKGNGGP